MIDAQLLAMLRCPLDHSPLSEADHALLQRINQGIAAKRVVNMSGQPVKKSIDGGLVRAAGDVLYPVVDKIPVMLRDEAIELSQLEAR